MLRLKLYEIWKIIIYFLQKVHIIVTVYDYDLIGTSDPIGRCSVGLNQPGQGAQHWMDMMNTPRRPIANWHTLKDPEPPKPEKPDKKKEGEKKEGEKK